MDHGLSAQSFRVHHKCNPEEHEAQGWQAVTKRGKSCWFEYDYVLAALLTRPSAMRMKQEKSG